MTILHATETAERVIEGPPAVVWGVGLLVALMGLLVAVLIFGKGRPHV
ncbi:MAG TPA: hypothetical protein VFH02_13675 [Jiangellaceae bacterium]|nr:hypothetical protein [Jiangellaceae bacterium]